jgi:hypothetical protein
MGRLHQTLHAAGSSTTEASMHFRFYLLDPDSKILAAEHFAAPNDTEALAVAALLWAACSDLCEDYDLWQGTRHVRGKWSKRVHSITAAVAIRRQQDIHDLEERLLEGFVTLKDSAKLAKRVAAHRTRVTERPSTDNVQPVNQT